MRKEATRKEVGAGTADWNDPPGQKTTSPSLSDDSEVNTCE